LKRTFNRKNAFLSIVAITIITLSSILISIPLASAHSPAWQIPVTAYLTVTPNPVGVGQNVAVVMWNDRPLQGGALYTDTDVRHTGYKLVITKPDGTNETHTWGVITDTTAAQFYSFTPTEVGNYSFVFYYPGLLYTWNRTSTQLVWTNDTFLPATSRTVVLNVQDQQLPLTKSSYPLPTEYWTRPIEGQNSDWYSISSNWLGGAQIFYNIQTDGIAPESAHIMWTKSIQPGGVVGGSVGVSNDVYGEMYYTGMSYNGRFQNPIIMNGRLYYQEPILNTGIGGYEKCLDLRTGEELWSRADVPSLAFGEYIDFNTGNQHGVIGSGVLYTTNFARAFDPTTGINVYNVTNVPSGLAALGSIGETLRYQLGSTNKWIAQWNSSKLWTATGNSPVITSPVDGGTADKYDWNVTVSLPTGSSIIRAFPGDLLIYSNLTPNPPVATGQTASIGVNNPYTVGAISLKTNSLGQQLWTMNYSAPANGVVRYLRLVDPTTREFITLDKQTFAYNAYSIDDGHKIWGPVSIPGTDDEYWSATENSWDQGSRSVAYDNLYSCGFGGILYCLDAKTGQLKWTYGNGGEGNSTNTGLGDAWGHEPLFIGAVADGKLYLFSSEHSPNTPLYKDRLIRCLNATTGEELWTLMGWGTSASFYSMNGAVADGQYTYLNGYDMQVYSIGKGPSETTVTAPDLSALLGQSITIRGTVMDISAGTTQNEQAARFPAGVPVVSDNSQTGWMEYVYMQKPRPSDTTGVSVIISVVDANGNYREIGTTTTNADGFFSLNWKPDIDGSYIVYASFAGSESYYPSHAVTSFAVDPTTATPTPNPTQVPNAADLYLLPGIIGLAIIIIIVGAVLALLLLRKHP
jgi:outer membrane protein assembly factor BamB